MEDEESARQLITALEESKLTNEEVSDLLMVPIPAVQRWREGINLPYRMTRTMVITILQRNKKP